MNKLILWDIDETILFDGKVGHAAFSRAIGTFLGIQDVKSVSKSGKTDYQIIREMLLANGFNDISDPVLKAVGKLYCESFKDIFHKNKTATLLPFAEETIRKLGMKEGVFQVLLTGNIKEIAIAKLSRFGLDKYFVTGGFGDDSESRFEIGMIALERAKINFKIKEFEAFVVGDTRNDIECGRKLNAVTVFYGGENNFGADYQINSLNELVEIVLQN